MQCCSASLGSDSVRYAWFWLLEPGSWTHALSARKARIWQFPLLELGWSLPVSETQKAGTSRRGCSTWQDKAKKGKDKRPPTSALPVLAWNPQCPQSQLQKHGRCSPGAAQSPAAWPSAEKGMNHHQQGRVQAEIHFVPKSCPWSNLAEWDLLFLC